jgi:NAD(P)H dehydrogenase (quinone)
MYLITGITGKVGSVVAGELLRAHRPVRAVARDVVKGRRWAEQGCDLVQGDMQDAASCVSIER